jgi:hypothetical protein
MIVMCLCLYVCMSIVERTKVLLQTTKEGDSPNPNKSERTKENPR